MASRRRAQVLQMTSAKRMQRAFGVGLAWIAATGFAGIASASGAPTLKAERTSFSIPSQPLADALMALGRQADVQILASSKAIAGRRSTGTSGRLKVEAALDHLLQGTGLDYEVIGSRTVVVHQREFTPATSYESPLRGTKPNVPIVSVLDTVRVSGLVLGDWGFLADNTRGATRTDAELADLPQSVSIVTRDLMDSRQAFEVADVVRHVAGVDYVDGFGGPPLFRIRGFTNSRGPRGTGRP